MAFALQKPAALREGTRRRRLGNDSGLEISFRLSTWKFLPAASCVDWRRESDDEGDSQSPEDGTKRKEGRDTETAERPLTQLHFAQKKEADLEGKQDCCEGQSQEKP